MKLARIALVALACSASTAYQTAVRHAWTCTGDGVHCVATGPDGATVVLRPRSIARVVAFPTQGLAGTHASIKCR